MTPDLKRFAREVFVAVLIIAAIAAVAYAFDLILLVFAGILLAILLRGAGDWLASHTGLSNKWSMVVVLVGFAVVFFGSIWMFGVQIANQADQLYAAVTKAYDELQQKVQHNKIGGILMSGGGATMNLGVPAKAAASGIIWVVTSIVLVLFLGLYVSTSPQLYTEMFLRFFDPPKRRRVEGVLEETASALRWWLFGQFISMGLVGLITITGLLIVGAPMAVPLGVVAGLLTFIPFVGAVVSALPAILLGFTHSGQMVLYIILVYLIAHIIEGYIVTPMIQHRMVYLPPAMILAMQFLMHIFVGVVGVTFATPVMVVAMVLIKNLYFKQDWNEDVVDAA